jgi:5-methylcytosine-specific restriction enzyme subunit McrC
LSEEKTHNGVAQDDMYQLYAYGTKYKECKKLYLIYPKDKDVKEIEYNYFCAESERNLPLKVLFFDVTKNLKKDDFKLTEENEIS